MLQPMTKHASTPERIHSAQTDMKGGKVLAQAFAALGLDYLTKAGVVLVETGTGKATISLKTGVVRAPAAWAPTVRKLRQRYAEAKVRFEAALEGVEIRGRMLDPKTGAIILRCRITPK
jgi:hypothetical protein